MEQDIVCPISHERIDSLPESERVTLPCCQTIFSRTNLREWIRRNMPEPRCPMCRCAIQNPQLYRPVIRPRRRSVPVSASNDDPLFVPLPPIYRNYGGTGTNYMGRTEVISLGDLNNMQMPVLQNRRRALKRSIIDCILSLVMYGIYQVGKMTRMIIFSLSVMLFVSLLINASPMVTVTAVGMLGTYILPKTFSKDITNHQNVIQRHIQDVIDSSVELGQIEQALARR